MLPIAVDILKSEKLSIKRFLCLCVTVIFSFGYGVFLAELPVDVFLDRDNYIKYVSESFDLLGFYKDGGGFSLLFNEPVWLLINVGLNYIFDDAEMVIRCYIFFGAIVTSFVALRFGSKYFFFVLLSLFFPQIIKNNIVHLRQGLAIALFLACFLINNQRWRYILMCFLPFIHASFFFILAFLAFDIFSRKNISNIFLRLVVLVFVSFSLTFSVAYMSKILGARQANEYLDVVVEASGLGFIFWIGVAGLFILQGKRYIDKYFFSFSILIFYLVSYFFLPVSARIFESGFILILFMGLALNSSRRYIFMAMLTVYSVSQYVRYWNDPWLGFGV